MRGFVARLRGQAPGRGVGLAALVALVAGVAVVLVVAFAGVLFGAWPPPAGVSQDEWQWCTDRAPGSGPGWVETAGADFLGWTPDGGLDHDGVTGAEVAARPNAGIACRVAYELWGHPSVALNAEEQAWCTALESRPVLGWLAQRMAMYEGFSREHPSEVQTCRLGFIMRSIPPTGS